MFRRYVEAQQRVTHMILAECDIFIPPDCHYNLRCFRCACCRSIDKAHICHWGVADGSAGVRDLTNHCHDVKATPRLDCRHLRD